MSVTPDAYTSGQTTTVGATSVTVAHTIAAQADAVFFGLGAYAAPSDVGKTLSATYNSVSGTSLGVLHEGAGTAGFIQLWFWPIGTGDGAAHNLVVTSSASLTSNDALAAHGASFYGASQTTPTATTTTGTSGAPSLAKTSAAGNQIIWAFGCGSSLVTPTQTQRSVRNIATPTAGGNSGVQTANGASSVTAAYADAGDWWAVFAVDVAAAAGGGGGTNFAFLESGLALILEGPGGVQLEG